MGLQRHDDVVLLLGAPGAGKGTQARFLADVLGIPHLASGDLLRENRQAGTDLGRAAQKYMDRGDLVPDGLVVDMIVDWLTRPKAAHGVLLDGFPRTIGQAEVLDNRLQQRGGRIRAAIYIEVSTEVLVERLAGRWMCGGCQATYHQIFNPPVRAAVCDRCQAALYQRPDDRREVVAKRVEVYLRDTLPLVERYEARGVLKRVNGDQSIEAVKAALRRAVGSAVAVAA